MIIPIYVDVQDIDTSKMDADEVSNVLETLDPVAIDIDTVTGRVNEVIFSNGQKEKFH